MKVFSVLLLLPALLWWGLQVYPADNAGRPSPPATHICQDTLKKPVVSLEETLAGPMHVVMIRDTAETAAHIHLVLNRDYQELFMFTQQNALKTGKVMVFYHSARPPFILDAAVETDSLPDQTTGRIRINKYKEGNVLIAHYQGPYEQIGMAYTAISAWLREHQKTGIHTPFEVYLNNPAMVKDSYELRTDVYQYIK
ncbi:MAG TPA: GyrI-like domain-containing protein [Chitinophagaceae bacterium]|nr:GyrI-like domain-containing protein [Chitinophagaceae bacterium]